MSHIPPMPDSPTEARHFMHCPSLPGFTFLDALNSSSPWRVYNYQYAIGIPSTWAANVMLDRDQQDVGPGDGVFNAPGELHWTPKVKQRGDLRALIIDEDVFQRHVEEHGITPRQAAWKRAFARPSTELITAFDQIFHTFYNQPDPMQLQTLFVDFFALLAREQLVGPRSEPKPAPGSAARRMRELIHHSPVGLTLDLSDLATAVGLTRFQALRAFKRQYGLPPHSYQLSVRAAVTRRLLEQGESATQVAHAAGFVDQSHLTHFFKRMHGSTPGAYARSAARALFPQSIDPSQRTDGVLWSI
jgi:AraC-like DNA-binding protein